ncbi:hypothetical protein BsWGS_14966 [Bradybaena similaris]
MSVADLYTSNGNSRDTTEGNYLPSHNIPPKSASSDSTRNFPTTGLPYRNNYENTNLLNSHQNVPKTTYKNYNSTRTILPDSGHVLNDATSPNVSINRDESVPDVEVFTGRRPLTLVTLMVLLVTCSSCLNSLMMDQYLYQYYAQIVFGNASMDTSSQPCANTSRSLTSSDTQADKLQEVQRRASGMSLNLSTTTYCIGILSNMLLGTFSCIMSRKLLLLIPTTGFLVKCALVPVIVYWKIDITWFYLGYGIDGICGNICGILLGTFLYTSDITPRDRKRTLGITVVETVKGAVGASFNVITGQLIEYTGYVIPAILAAGTQFMAVLVICILPDRKPVLSEKQLRELKSVKGALLHMFSPFHVPKIRRVKYMISLAAAAFLLIITARVGIDKVQNLYVMNLPFCFDAITIGWFLFVRDAIQHLFMLLVVAFLFRHLPGMILGIAGAMSVIAYCFVYSYARSSWEILYLVPCLGLAQAMPFSIIRGESSRLLGSENQGPLFATLAVVESFGYAAGAPLFLSIYRATLDYFTGFVFLVGAGIVLVVCVIMGVYHRLWTVHVRSIQYNTLTVSPLLPDDQSEQFS